MLGFGACSGIMRRRPGVEPGMRGDRVEIVVDAGATTRTWEVAATAAGRRVEVSSGRGMLTVTEVTRGGTPVRTAQFMTNRVLAVVEHPAPRHAPEQPSAVPLPRPA
jgi:hypothetical protein